MSRGTGRTTATLDLARQLVKEGRRVYVIAANARHALSVEQNLTQDGDGKITVLSGTNDLLIDWELAVLRGHSRDTVVLFDHYAYEQKIGQLQRENERLKEQTPRKEDLVLLMKFASQAMGGWPSNKEAYEAMGRIAEITRSL